MRAKNELQQLAEAYQHVLLEAQFEGAYVESSEVEPQPDLNQLEGSFQAKKDPSVKYRYRVAGPQGETIPSLEKNEKGQYVQKAPAGNIILTGHVKNENHPDGEEWSQKPDKFKQKYTVVEGDDQSGVAQAKAEDPVLLKQMSQPFKVITSWANLDGNPGDLLTMYGPNDYGVLNQGAFDMYYNKV